MIGEENQQAVWNFDGAEAQVLYSLKERFIWEMREWDLESAYWTVRAIRMEIDAKLNRGKKKMIEEFEKDLGKEIKETEKDFVDRIMKEVDNERDIFLNSQKNDEVKGRFYFILEKFYMEICYIMKKHGLYFREGEDNTLAILRR